jgi:microcystin-dependent protein
MSGVESITLLQTEMPVHSHTALAQGTDDSGNATTPVNAVWAKLGGARGGGGFNLYHTAANGTMNLQALSPTGGGLPHNNMQPYLTLNFCIALQGIFPQRP